MTVRWQRLGMGLVELGWLACIVWVPLVISLAVSLTFTADKVLSFRMVAELLALAALVLWLRRPRVKPSPLTLAVGGFGLILVLATLCGRNLIQGFWGSYLRLFGLFTLLHGGVLYLVVAAHFRTERQWWRLLGGVALVSLLVCVHALLQWRGYEDRVMPLVFGQRGWYWTWTADPTNRPFATLGNPSYLGTFLVFAIVFTLGAAASLPRGRRWLAYCLLGLLALVLVINQTRGAWLATVAACFTFALLTAVPRRRRVLVRAALVLGTAVLLVGAVAARNAQSPWVTSNPIVMRLAHFLQHDRNSSGWYRLDMWRRVGADVAASPAALLLGYGPESYQSVSNRSFVPAYADGDEGPQFMDSTHNIFLDTLVDAGLVGLTAFLVLLLLAFRTGLRALRGATPTQRIVLVTALSALVGYVIQGLFLFNHTVTLVYLCVCLGLIAAASRDGWGSAGDEAELPVGDRRASRKPSHRARRLAAGALAGVGIVIIGGVLLPANARIYRAQALKRLAEEAVTQGRRREATEAVREACRLMPWERALRVELGSRIAGELTVDGDPEMMIPAFRAAEREMRRAIALDPEDVRSYWPLALLYQFWGALDRSKFAAGEELYRRAAAVSPRRQRTYWAWGELLLAQGRRPQALAKYRYALEIDPSVAASQRALAGLYVRLGQPEQAEPLFERAWRHPSSRIGLPAVIEKRAAEQAELGLAFLAQGRAEKARAYLTGALDLNPNLPRVREALEQLARRQATAERRVPQQQGKSAG